ncbi:hypothetical protein ACPW7J_05725 [Ihubacter sp. rT4E-8]|uniref:hypothetical protein n=1 Tax=Ihubacter sp. rT4E-8 TaxID=3242369 RepID=UPI003CED45BF
MRKFVGIILSASLMIVLLAVCSSKKYTEKGWKIEDLKGNEAFVNALAGGLLEVSNNMDNGFPVAG